MKEQGPTSARSDEHAGGNMATSKPRPDPVTAPSPAKVEDNTLDEQHAGITERTFPVTDNDQSAESGQSHVADAPPSQRKKKRTARSST